MLKTSSLVKWGAAALLLSSLTSCEDILEQYFPKPTPPPVIPTFPPLGQDIAFYALSGGTRLDGYSTTNAATRTSSVAITGLGSGETLLAIDFRPATGQLYGVSSASRLYVINQNTGAARAIGAGAFTPTVAGNLLGFDFNPTVDRIRLVTSTGQNLRINPETGTVAATDGVLNGATGATITGAAYTNNTAGAETTVLYDLDPATDQLYRQDPPNAGTLVAVGNLNLNITGDGGFDIDARTGTALGLYAVNGNPTLFAVNLTTGVARPLAQYAANAGYTGLAIPTQPVAYLAAFRSDGARSKSNSLVIFNPTNTAVLVNKPITGFRDSEVISGLDFRPANGQLYAVTDEGRLFTLNAASGAATLVAPTFIPTDITSTLGFDFNPVADRIRIVTFRGANLRVNPNDGSTIVDEPLNPGTPTIEAAAYDNTFVGATATTLYTIGGGDANSNRRTPKLFRQSPPNAGTLVEIGELGLEPGSYINFDIGSTSNAAYAITSNFPRPQLYTLNLATGRATAVGSLNLESLGLNFYLVSGFTLGLGF
jgi:hypothetical protein